jgi:hydrogenase expression/formation protein HypC
MCLGVPGKIIEIRDEHTDFPLGRVSFSGVVKEVCLAYTPEARVGDFVLVHVGFALSRLDEAEANRVFEYLEEIERLAAAPTEGNADSDDGTQR